MSLVKDDSEKAVVISVTLSISQELIPPTKVQEICHIALIDSTLETYHVLKSWLKLEQH